MLNKGVPKEVLQTLLGHRSIKTTERYANWVTFELNSARQRAYSLTVTHTLTHIYQYKYSTGARSICILEL